MTSNRYIGIDGCKAGWFIAGLDEQDNWQCGILNHIAGIMPYLVTTEMVLIDIPIGLREFNKMGRLCDIEARKVLRLRKSSIFTAPSSLSLN